MASFIDEFRRDFGSPVILIVWGALTVIFGLSGPFGSYAAVSMPMRVLGSASIVTFGMLGCTAGRALVISQYQIEHPILRMMFIAKLNTVIWTPVAYFLLPRFYPRAFPEFPSYIELMFFIFTVCTTVGMFRHAIKDRIAPDGVMATDPAGDPALALNGPSAGECKTLVRLLQRLPEEMLGALEAISVRDHYVDVRTSAGQSSLLMRLSDAIAEAEGVEGAQVHRSHWVAWQAITHTERDGAKLLLVLRDGSKIPVSRNHREKVDARGLV